MTHKGTIIPRGFNVAKQRKQRITSTQDQALLVDPKIRNLFNEDRHKMTSYIEKLGPPRKHNPIEMSKQQFKRIQKAGFSYETLDEKPRTVR